MKNLYLTGDLTTYHFGGLRLHMVLQIAFKISDLNLVIMTTLNILCPVPQTTITYGLVQRENNELFIWRDFQTAMCEAVGKSEMA